MMQMSAVVERKIDELSCYFYSNLFAGRVLRQKLGNEKQETTFIATLNYK